MSHSSTVLFAMLLTAGSSPPARPGRCTDPTAEGVRYFGKGATVESWLALRLCQMGEPALRQPQRNAVRCTFAWSFHPVVAIRLVEGDCTAEVSAWDDRDERHPRAFHVRRRVADCTAVTTRLRTSAVSGDVTPSVPGGVRVDGGSIGLERLDGATHTFGFSDSVGNLAPASMLTLACEQLARAAGFSSSGDRDDPFGSVTLVLREALAREGDAGR